MADGIYVSMCGAVARADQLDAVADNLANVQTRGFKASRPAFEAFLPAAGGYDKSYTASVATSLDLRPGPSTTTGNPLDVLPEDGAFLAVKSGDAVAYTRDGQVALDTDRRLVIRGNPVLGKNGQPIVVPHDYLPEISADGAVRARLPSGSEGRGRAEEVVLGELATYQLSGSVDRVGPALLRLGPGGRADAVAEVRVRVGEAELSNSSALESMVQMIAAQRSFDASMQAIQTYRTMDQRAAELGRTR
jgi:flagellar basal-body rod protein FlgF